MPNFFVLQIIESSANYGTLICLASDIAAICCVTELLKFRNPLHQVFNLVLRISWGSVSMRKNTVRYTNTVRYASILAKSTGTLVHYIIFAQVRVRFALEMWVPNVLYQNEYF